ncbi:MAG: hypothetical protein RIR11_2949 [Bacteroidota bacterium]|jgi:hypothetical protein
MKFKPTGLEKKGFLVSRKSIVSICFVVFLLILYAQKCCNNTTPENGVIVSQDQMSVFERDSCHLIDSLPSILARKGFRKLPIEIHYPVVSKQKDTVSFRNTASYSIIDSANLEIKMTNEIFSVYNSLVDISTFCSFSFKAYITKNENFCPGLYFFQADNEYASPDGYDAVVWFHIFDGDPDYLYIKWLDFRKPGNDVFGFEYLFHLSEPLPNPKK